MVAVLFATFMMVCLALPAGAGPNRWTESGPPHGACHSGGICAEVTSIAIDPFDDNVLYATMLRGAADAPEVDGLWRSSDAGTTWSKMSVPRDYQVLSIAVSKTNPRTLYLLTWDSLYRSSDGGNSWGASTLPDSFNTALVVDAVNDKTLFVSRETLCGFGTCINGGIQRSDDNGKNWRSMGLEHKTVSAIFAARTVPDLLLGIDADRIMQTTNRGDSWKDVTPPGAGKAWMVAVDPLNRSTVYATTGTYSDPHRGIYKSIDRGKTWRLLEDEQFEEGGQNVIAVDPYVATHLLATTGHGKLLRSVDAGESWNALEDGRGTARAPLQIVIGRSGTVFHASFSDGSILHYSIVHPRRRAVH